MKQIILAYIDTFSKISKFHICLKNLKNQITLNAFTEKENTFFSIVSIQFCYEYSL